MATWTLKLCAVGRHGPSCYNTNTFFFTPKILCDAVLQTHFVLAYIFEEATQMGIYSMLWNNLSLDSQVVKFCNYRNSPNDIVWIKDGTPLHLEKVFRKVQGQHFGDRIPIRNFPFLWPSWSPDLSPIICHYTKCNICMCSHQTLLDLRDFIKREIANIPRALLSSIFCPLFFKCNTLLHVMTPIWKIFKLN